MTKEPAYIKAKRKLNDATKWRGDVNVSLGDETVTFKHRLLNESEFLAIKRVLDTEALSDAKDDDDSIAQTDAQERLLELQEKDVLDAEEEAELRELTNEVATQTNKIENALGKEGYELLMAMGKKAIKPSDDDVSYVYDCSPSEMKNHMGIEELPQPITTSVIEKHLSDELSEMIDNQPYPIKLNVGMQAFAETMSVLGNGLQT